jgi:hypothetical protein
LIHHFKTATTDARLHWFVRRSNQEKIMRVFRVNDFDWWMAETAEQAKSAAIEFYGDEDMVDEVVELTDDQLSSHTFYDEDDETTKTFEQQLLKRIKEGATTPEMFASTEY